MNYVILPKIVFLGGYFKCLLIHLKKIRVVLIYKVFFRVPHRDIIAVSNILPCDAVLCIESKGTRSDFKILIKNCDILTRRVPTLYRI